MQLAGKAIIRIDGAVIPTENGAKLNVGGISRKGERHGGKRYHVEEEVNPTIECNVLITKETDAIALSDVTGATIEFEADTGQHYVMRDADTIDPGEVDTGTGKMTLKFEGDTVDII